MDDEHRPPGRDFDASHTEPKFGPNERPIAEYLRKQGNDIWPIRRSNKERGPDASVGEPHPFVGKPTKDTDYGVLRNSIVCVDFKRETAGRDSHKKIIDAVRFSLGIDQTPPKTQQTRNIIVDARGSKLVAAHARMIYSELLGQTQGRLDYLRIVGSDFDVTFHGFQ